MKRRWFSIVALCLISLGIIGCGNDESTRENSLMDTFREQPKPIEPQNDDVDIGKVEAPEPQEEALAVVEAINIVLRRWRNGYENENLELYISAFWADGFRYMSDMGTDGDVRDDLMFDDIRVEKESAERVFAQFRDIDIELSLPDITLNPEGTRAEVSNHYKIQAIVRRGHALEGGFEGWLAAGDNRFTFERRNDEWRITEWVDEAFDALEIVQVHGNKPLPALEPPRLATTWGRIKAR
jgi:hypothetical protein